MGSIPHSMYCPVLVAGVAGSARRQQMHHDERAEGKGEPAKKKGEE